MLRYFLQIVPVISPEPPPLMNLTPLPNYATHVPSLPHIVPTSANPLHTNMLPQLHQVKLFADLSESSSHCLAKGKLQYIQSMKCKFEL